MSRRPAGWAAMLRPPSSAGLAAASLALGASVIPSLYPRSWAAQAVVSGAAVALGYGLGCAVGSLFRKAAARPLSALEPTGSRAIRVAVLSGAVGVAAWALVLNYRWQVDVRGLMGIGGSPAAHLLVAVPAALAIGLALVATARLLRAGRRAYLRQRTRIVPLSGPPRLGQRVALRVGVALLLAFLVLDGLVADRMVPRVQASLAAADARLDPGVARPTSIHRSGGPGSLIAWEGLGRMGRRFVADGPSVTDVAAFGSVEALEPIRVYVGLSAAASARDRARLAVAELERTGAFDREVLVLIAPTGTGGVNSHAISPLELMHGGDTAAVAVQYSLSPSWLTMAGNQERAKQAASHLFAAVSRRLAREPITSRPQVLLYGESLGAFGSESVVTDIDEVPRLVAGALWVGPPAASRLWRQLTAGRDAGSPVWRPTYRGGATVRFGHDGASLSDPTAVWRPPRLAYLQHPSDPVTWWGADALLRRPEWMAEPRGPDVSERMPFVPVVTFLQTGIDMVLGANAPLGHGHMYGPEHAEAWALVAPPDGWSERDTLRLVADLPAVTDAAGD